MYEPILGSLFISPCRWFIVLQFAFTLIPPSFSFIVRIFTCRFCSSHRVLYCIDDITIHIDFTKLHVEGILLKECRYLLYTQNDHRAVWILHGILRVGGFKGVNWVEK